jgi:hypothetical protein
MKPKYSCVVSADVPITLGTFKVIIDTVDGDSLPVYSTFPTATLKVTSKFVRRGGWNMFNGHLDGRECCIQDNDSKRVLVYFEKHNSGIKE